MWSKLVDKPIGQIAKAFYQADSRRKFHNWDHVISNYGCAESLNIAYDVDLDLANMFHDIVYDDLPEKEKRSAELFLLIYSAMSPIPDVNPDRVYQLIMTTAEHEIEDDPQMVSIDLYNLSIQQRAIIDYEKVKQESKLLYGISDLVFAKASTEFMQQLLPRVIKYRDLASIAEPEKSKFWQNVSEGVERVISLNQAVLIYGETSANG